MNEKEQKTLEDALKVYYREVGRRIESAESDSTIGEYQLERKRVRNMLKDMCGWSQKEANNL